VTETEGGSLTILQAWAPFAASMVRTRTTAEEFTAYLEHTQDAARAGLKILTGPFGARLAGARIELRQGEPEDVIPEFVVAEGIDLVVMGTVARTGIAGLLIGNTAERLLHRLPCSVLAVKPDGFHSPVEPAP
jgi:nucleotide-binding universal stress UspA family protein